MASHGFLPKVTLFHLHSEATQSFSNLSVLEALAEQFRRSHPEGTPVPPPVYEMTSVHLEGEEWGWRFSGSEPLPRSQWRHFKGGIMEVLEMGRCSETLAPVVIYWEHASGAIWVRPLLMFWENVEPDVQRFTRIQ